MLVTDTSGTVETFNNNGGGFPISDSVIVQTPQSCLSNGNLTVLAAVGYLKADSGRINIYNLSGSRHGHYTSDLECHSEGPEDGRKSNRLSSPVFSQ